MKNFCARLNEVAPKGDFTVADLSRWFDRPYHTVWFWVNKSREPRGSKLQRKLVYGRLDLLERAIRFNTKLPIPPSLNQFERVEYIEKLRHDLED
jgi:hypothetical protein